MGSSTDDYFQYRLKYIEAYKDKTKNEPEIRKIFILITELPGKVGDSLHQIESDSSEFIRYLNRFDPSSSWIAFLVGESEIELFQKARNLAVMKGFSTGWDFGNLDFPLEEEIKFGGATSSDGLEPSPVLSTEQISN